MRSATLLAVVLASFLPASGLASSNDAPIVRHGVKNIVRGASTNQTSVRLRSNDPTGAVSPNPQVYLVFWGSQWRNGGDPAGAAPALQTFFSNLYGTKDTWGTTLDQYCEGLPAGTVTCTAPGVFVTHPTSSPLAGVWFDDAAPAPDKANSSQIGNEAAAAAAHFGNTTQAPNLNAQYVIASPSGTHPDGFPKTGFCGWHTSTPTKLGTIAFTNLPYVPDLGAGGCTTMPAAQLLDGYFSTETHEYAETVTDFFPSSGWLGQGGAEIGDLCENLDSYLKLGGQNFDVQGLWSNAAGGCVTNGT
jgi:serine protease